MQDDQKRETKLITSATRKICVLEHSESIPSLLWGSLSLLLKRTSLNPMTNTSGNYDEQNKCFHKATWHSRNQCAGIKVKPDLQGTTYKTLPGTTWDHAEHRIITLPFPDSFAQLASLPLQTRNMQSQLTPRLSQRSPRVPHNTVR